jgi:hypothetical protein
MTPPLIEPAFFTVSSLTGDRFLLRLPALFPEPFFGFMTASSVLVD